MYLINKLYIFAVHQLVKVSGYVQSKWAPKGSKNAPIDGFQKFVIGKIPLSSHF